MRRSGEVSRMPAKSTSRKYAQKGNYLGPRAMTLSSFGGASLAASENGRGAVLAANCPSRMILQHVTGRWGVLILLVLLKGTHRFSDLRRSVGGVSEKMLAQTLHALEGDGFVLRKAYDEVPPRVEYRLSRLGVEVAQHVEALANWIEFNLPRIGSQQRSEHEVDACEGS
jgi:DNA-binding HxlR family transcriptional regulator